MGDHLGTWGVAGLTHFVVGNSSGTVDLHVPVGGPLGHPPELAGSMGHPESGMASVPWNCYPGTERKADVDSRK